MNMHEKDASKSSSLSGAIYRSVQRWETRFRMREICWQLASAAQRCMSHRGTAARWLAETDSATRLHSRLHHNVNKPLYSDAIIDFQNDFPHYEGDIHSAKTATSFCQTHSKTLVNWTPLREQAQYRTQIQVYECYQHQLPCDNMILWAPFTKFLKLFFRLS